MLSELEKVINLLVNEQPIPRKYKDHGLRGGFKGTRECHLQPDTLLLYFTVDHEVLKLIDIGSHASVLKM